ncbi:HAMP domain-containing histidine kinase [Tissierella carlieri]|uniref:sensor histidine kinase n=1 Tax=Tissierella carlieri TaxID=689904 RepID=UPI001C10C46F|nr:HAMP domain-containing sensor histidine kinase [Tissierella carlieri]MBU5310818.1 HAMP domain-containing histidine kinase [Tissierella carlieri]
MKNKKIFIIIFLTNLILFFFLYKIIDGIYYREVSNLIDLEVYGYGGSMTIYEDRSLVLILIVLFSIIISSVFIYIYNQREKNFLEYIKMIKSKLSSLSEGDYFISIDEVNSLGALYDELYKLVLELREGRELAIRDKLKLKENLEDISHQLKTPLASIEILIELYKENKDEKHLDKIDCELSKINYLISSMLTIARLDVNQIEFKSEEFSIREAINASIESLEAQIQENPIEILADGEDFTIIGDFYWIVEALINIVKNSIEYGRSQIQIMTRKTNVYSEIIIKDDGEGFSKEDLNKLFQRFYKSKNSAAGAGIGLNLSKNILEKHNATIFAENDRGGKFTIKFY